MNKVLFMSSPQIKEHNSFTDTNQSVSYSLAKFVSPWNMFPVRQPMRLLERSLEVWKNKLFTVTSFQIKTCFNFLQIERSFLFITSSVLVMPGHILYESYIIFLKALLSTALSQYSWFSMPTVSWKATLGCMIYSLETVYCMPGKIHLTKCEKLLMW